MVKLAHVKARLFGLKCFKLFLSALIYMYISNVDQKKYQLSGFIHPGAPDV